MLEQVLGDAGGGGGGLLNEIEPVAVEPPKAEDSVSSRVVIVFIVKPPLSIIGGDVCIPL